MPNAARENREHVSWQLRGLLRQVVSAHGGNRVLDKVVSGKSTVLGRYVRWSVWALGGTLFVAAVCLLLRPPLVNPLTLEYWPEHLVGARRFFAYTFVWRGTSEERLVKRFGRPTETMLTGTHQWHDYVRKQAALGFEPVPSDWSGRVLVYEVQGDIHAITAYYLLKPDGRLKAANVSDQLL